MKLGEVLTTLGIKDTVKGFSKTARAELERRVARHQELCGPLRRAEEHQAQMERMATEPASVRK